MVKESEMIREEAKKSKWMENTAKESEWLEAKERKFRDFKNRLKVKARDKWKYRRSMRVW